MRKKIVPGSFDIVLGFVVLFGLFLRLYQLQASSLWLDEIMTSGRIQTPTRDILHDLLKTPFPPLYYVFMHYWTGFAGLSVYTLRLPSALFSTLIIPAAFFFTRELYDRKTALTAAFLLSLSPYAIFYGQDAKMYPLLWLLGILSFYFFYRMMREGRKSDVFWHCLVTTLAIYTLYIGFVFILIQVGLFLFWSRRLHWKQYVLSLACTLILFFPWAAIFITQAAHRTGIQWIPNIGIGEFSLKLIREIIFGRGYHKLIQPPKPMLIAAFAGIYILIGLSNFIRLDGAGKRRRLSFEFEPNSVFVASLVAGTLLIYGLIHWAHYPILIVRYVGWIHIPLAILAARALWRFRPPTRVILSVFVMAGLLFAVHFYYRHAIKTWEDWKEMFVVLQKEISETPDSHLIVSSVCSPRMQPVFNRAVRVYNAGKPLEAMHEAFFLKNRKELLSQNFRKIFIVYRKKEAVPEISLQGYEAVDHSFLGQIGFLEFKKVTPHDEK